MFDEIWLEINLILHNHQYVKTQHHEENGLQNISHLRVKTESMLINMCKVSMQVEEIRKTKQGNTTPPKSCNSLTTNPKGSEDDNS